MLGSLKKRVIEPRVMVAEFAVEPQFTFSAGEYVRIFLPNREKRYFTIASSPNEKGIVRIATRPSQSEFKKTLQEMPLGTEVEIQGPWGDLLLPRSYSQPLVFIAGGIGITPFLSMLAYIVEGKLPYEITLLYFAGDKFFEDELVRVMREIGKGKLIIIPEPITSEILKNNGGDLTKNLFYLAGPPGFVNTATASLRSLGVLDKNIMFESYTGY